MKINFLSVEQVKISINKQLILSGVDFAIAQGEMVAIIGANGSGKSTLLRVLCGILPPTAGKLLIANHAYSHSQQSLAIKKIIGYAPDNPPLYPYDTVQSYLELIVALKQIPSKNRAERINTVLDLFDLTPYRMQRINTLSKGTQQRINLAQAIIHTPQILILDEPTNGIDVDQLQNFIEYLDLLRKQNVTIVIASHNYTDLIPLCDYMLKLQNHTVEKILLPNTNIKVTAYDQVAYTP